MDLEQLRRIRIVNYWFGDTVVKTFNVTPQQVAQLRDGKWYLDVHSQNHPNGEIRGQLNAVRLPANSPTIEYGLLRTFPGFGGMFFLGQNYSSGESFIHSSCGRLD